MKLKMKTYTILVFLKKASFVYSHNQQSDNSDLLQIKSKKD
ncbi:MAG: hypothetical protein PWQ58_276 [Archaeoglobaceae archaeon]|nr:hypothetical protein [Archaeoglobaceae archaeon]